MTTQRSFLVDGMGERFALPEVPAAEPELSPFGKFCRRHDWFVPWVRDYLRRQIVDGAKSVSVRAAMEAARPKVNERAKTMVAGAGPVTLNNNWQMELTQELYRVAPDLRPYIRRRAG